MKQVIAQLRLRSRRDDQQEQPHSPPEMGLEHAYKNQTLIWTDSDLTTSLIISVDHSARVNGGNVM